MDLTKRQFRAWIALKIREARYDLRRFRRRKTANEMHDWSVYYEGYIRGLVAAACFDGYITRKQASRLKRIWIKSARACSNHWRETRNEQRRESRLMRMNAA